MDVFLTFEELHFYKEEKNVTAGYRNGKEKNGLFLQGLRDYEEISFLGESF